MTHTEIIWVLVTASFASTFGVYAVIRVIKQYTRPPMNTLTRGSGDIELNYIEPTQSNYPDLLTSQYQTYETIQSLAPSYQTGIVPPSYRSAILPPYQSVDRLNCPLELNSWDFSLLLILIFLLIIWIIYLKTNSLNAMSTLIPFSFFDIDFRDSFEWKLNSCGVKPKISYLKIQNLTEDIIKLLISLKDDENYSMSLSFISSYKDWEVDKEKVHPLFIDDAIIVNKDSDPILITQFIMNRLNDKFYFVTNWLIKDSSINSMDPVILTVTVPIKVKI